MENNNVLLNIFDTLHRLETKLEGQDYRLVTIEQSIRSGSISPSPDDLEFHLRPSLSTADGHSWKGKPLPARPASSKATSPVSLYAASIDEMRRRFDFVDDSQSDIHGPDLEPQVEAGPSTPRSLKPAVQCDDGRAEHDGAYTLSVYSSDLLSKANLPQAARLNRASCLQIDHDEIGNGELDKGKGKFVTVLGEPSPDSLPHKIPPRARTTSSWRSRSSRKSIDSQSSRSSQESHERVAMTYYACNNFVRSLQGSRSFRSTERRFNMEERRRLKCLSPAADSRAKVRVSQQGPTAWLVMLRGVLFRLFTSAHSGRSQRVLVIA